MPPRSVVTIEGLTWIVGQKNTDSFQGSAIRNKYVIHQAQALGKLQTVKQLLTTGGVDLYSSAIWVKDSKEVESSSKLYSFMDTFFALGEDVFAGQVLTLGADKYRIRNVYLGGSGIQIGEASVMPRLNITSITYMSTSGLAYNAASDSFGTITPTVFNGLWERFQDSYNYETASAPKYVTGDLLLVVEKSSVATPKSGDTLTMFGFSWIVISFQDDLNLCWELQVRRA
ncbi:hypothetical protein [Methylotenera sp.]|uniref:hypothetical protein n=1 Tax=Methylotenera sp. TaxID=2051956 RepID=UPI00248933F4|nr:hypothetical protein [Methylotenera sp.]MDI1362515.1 hypothetical protein [Methylotenera sp.]